VLAEAIASGIPVVGSNSGAIPEVLENVHGTVFPEGDVAALASVLNDIYKSPPASSFLPEGIPYSSMKISELLLDTWKKAA
jgi:glycosyltransferase involved in cell wall biosynthesis